MNSSSGRALRSSRRAATEAQGIGNRATKRAPQTGDSRASPTPAPSSTAVEGELHPGYTLRLAIDYGTVNLNAAYAIRSPDVASSNTPIYPITFNSQTDSPVLLLWSQVENKLLWGHEVVEKLKGSDFAPAIAQRDVIRLPKLALYDLRTEDTHLKDTIDLIEKQLREVGDGVSIVELISMHLKSVVAYCVSYVRSTVDGRNLYDGLEIDVADLAKEIYLSVPEAWDPSSNEKMRDAAAQAEIGPFQLVLEPQCAAAYAMHQHLKSRDQLDVRQQLAQSADNTQHLVIDAGGGTVDVIKYRMLDGAGEQCRLETIGEARGGVCGSTQIDRVFAKDQIARLKVSPPFGNNFKGFLKQLGINEEDLKQQLMTGFQHHKEIFRTPHDPMHYSAVIRGSQGGAQQLWSIMWSHHDMTSYYDEVIADVYQLVDDIVRNAPPEYITLTGGFGRSTYLKEKVEARYPSSDVLPVLGDNMYKSNPVTEGALLRNDKIAMEGLTLKYSFFVVRDDIYDVKRHPDCGLRPERIKKSLFDTKVKIVSDRVAPLVPKGKRLQTEDERIYAPIWQNFYIVPGQTSFGVDIYWAKTAVREHVALQDLEEHSDYRHWKTIWTPITEAELGKLDYKFRTQRRKDGKKQCLIRTQLVFKMTGALMEVGVIIVRKGCKTEFIKACQKKDKTLQDRLSKVKWHNVWDAKSSHIAHDGIWTGEGDGPDLSEEARRRRRRSVVDLEADLAEVSAASEDLDTGDSDKTTQNDDDPDLDDDLVQPEQRLLTGEDADDRQFGYETDSAVDQSGSEHGVVDGRDPPFGPFGSEEEDNRTETSIDDQKPTARVALPPGKSPSDCGSDDSGSDDSGSDDSGSDDSGSDDESDDGDESEDDDHEGAGGEDGQDGTFDQLLSDQENEELEAILNDQDPEASANWQHDRTHSESDGSSDSSTDKPSRTLKPSPSDRSSESSDTNEESRHSLPSLEEFYDVEQWDEMGEESD